MSTKEISEKIRRRGARKVHVRKSISGTAERPRLTVFKSNKYLYVQAIDDEAGVTIAAASTLEKALEGTKPTVEGGAKLGELMGARLGEKKIGAVVFDRNGYNYHGVVKAIADGTRKAGIKF
ncbi:MAG TPA: 50S ribosomal protein L18 [Spirochaetales bacterium]|nr:50S ribosomal protein L18 [Spirochaetales bacterium]HPB65968.1 50S ribosomal protein L18 [Spirochaetales bacterium]HPM73637.1 50S ribosomal protein L18 [Spirochaetales bacterium]